MRLQRVAIVVAKAGRECIRSFLSTIIPLHRHEAYALPRAVADSNGVLWHI